MLLRTKEGTEIEKKYNDFFPNNQKDLLYLGNQEGDFLCSIDGYDVGSAKIGVVEVLKIDIKPYFNDYEDGLKQLWVTNFSVKNQTDFIYIPTWRNRQRYLYHAMPYEKEMYLIAWLMGFNKDIIPNEYDGFSTEQIQTMNKIIGKCNSFKSLDGECKKILKSLFIMPLPGRKEDHLYALGKIVHKNITREELVNIIVNVYLIQKAFMTIDAICYREWTF